MIVIEGKSGKSVELQSLLLEEMSKNRLLQTLMIDTVGINHINIDGLVKIQTDLSNIWASNFISECIYELRKYDLIVFYTNDKKEMISNYEQLEKLINVQCIVTIQNDELETLSTYSCQ